MLQHPHLEILFVASVPKSLGGCPGDALITCLDEKIGLHVREDGTLHSCTHSHQQGARPPLKTGGCHAAKKIIAGAFFWCTTWCAAHWWGKQGADEAGCRGHHLPWFCRHRCRHKSRWDIHRLSTIQIWPRLQSCSAKLKNFCSSCGQVESGETCCRWKKVKLRLVHFQEDLVKWRYEAKILRCTIAESYSIAGIPHHSLSDELSFRVSPCGLFAQKATNIMY